MALMKKAKETKEEKRERKDQEILEKYGIENISDPEIAESLRRIATEMSGSNIFEIGALANLKTKPEDILQMQLQRTMVEQNFIIIRQLDKLAKLLDK